jgi:hypothetical protein
MNRGQLRARTRFFLDEPTEQNFTDSDINTALNIAQDQVTLDINQANQDYFISPNPTTITLTSGTERYALAGDVLSIKRVEDAATGLEILPFDFNEKAAPGLGMPGLVSAAPGNWYLLGSYIGFSPIPSASSTVNYWYVTLLPQMTTDSDVSQIPRPYQDMLAIRAAIDSFIKDEADAGPLRGLYAEYIDRLKRTANNRQKQAPKHVRRVSYPSNYPATGPF